MALVLSVKNSACTALTLSGTVFCNFFQESKKFVVLTKGIALELIIKVKSEVDSY